MPTTTLINPGIDILVHLDKAGDIDFTEGEISGSQNQQRGLLGFQLQMTDRPPGLGLEYWAIGANGLSTGWLSEGHFAGNRSANDPLVSMALRLTGEAAANYELRYRVYLGIIGENKTEITDWVTDGSQAGHQTGGKQIEAFQISIRPVNRPSEKHKALFTGLREFQIWQSENSEEEAGLPKDSTIWLKHEIPHFLSEIANMDVLIQRALYEWDRMDNQSTTMVKMRARVVLHLLEKLVHLNIGVMAMAGQIEVAILELQTTLNLHIEADQLAIDKAQKRLIGSVSKRTNLEAQLVLAQKELDSPEGGFKSAITVITFGGVNLIQDEIDKINLALKALDRQKELDNQQVEILKKSEAELTAANEILQKIGELETVLNDFQNIFTSLSADLKEAVTQEASLASNELETLYQYYYKRADDEMQDLKLWGAVLSA